MFCYSFDCLLCIVLLIMAFCFSLICVLIYPVFSSFYMPAGGGCYD